ncbi:MAG: hydrolase [Pseudomonadota bacterium]
MKKPARAWQRMLSGRRLDLLDPSALDIEIDDIAHGLSRVARWNGQTHGEWAFSVAQHSVLVEQLTHALKPKASVGERLYALLHDAPEYVVGDLISPFKAMIGDQYKALETRLLGATLVRFGLPPEPSATAQKLVKRADRLAAHAEAVQLAGFEPEEANRFFGAPPGDAMGDLRLTPQPPEEAKAAFLARFAALQTALETERPARRRAM